VVVTVLTEVMVAGQLLALEVALELEEVPDTGLLDVLDVLDEDHAAQLAES